MKKIEIIEKLKKDIEEQERSYQEEQEKLKKEEILLNYIRGMLDITDNSVSNFPYYDGKNKDEHAAEEEFDKMLKYTLKEEKMITAFKLEIKNLYYLEKIGYQHAEQYKETIKKLEEYRKKIEQSYNDLIANENLKEILAKKEEILEKLDTVKNYLTEEQEELENMDSFYEGLQYAHLSEVEKTSILLSIFEKSIKKELNKSESKTDSKYQAKENKIGKIKEEDIEKFRTALKKLENHFQIKITYPTTEGEKPSRVEKNRFIFAEI